MNTPRPRLSASVIAAHYKARLSHHLMHDNTSTTEGGGGKDAKRHRKRTKSRPYRFAACAARKDTNVFRSSRGKYGTCESLPK